MSAKGSENERDLAKRFSLWWTAGADDDVFWRVGGSGGRAKRRGRKGLATEGQAADMMATNPIGEPLLKLFTLELKKGYPRTGANPFEEVDRIKPLTPAKDNFAGWIEQVEESRQQAKTPYWMIGFRRPRRREVICMPTQVILAGSQFDSADRSKLKGIEAARMIFRVRNGEWYLSFFPLDELLATMTPDMVRAANKRRV